MNAELLKIAREMLKRKEAFVDPATASGGGMDPAAMGADPAAMGGGMPMDPAMAGMDPAAMGGGGAPPPPPAGGGMDMNALQTMIQSAVQAAMGGQGGGGAAGGGAGAAMGIKPKIDVNVALMQLSKMVAKLCDAQGIQIPASEMIATPQDLNSMAQQQTASANSPQQGAIQPIQPLQPAFPSGGGGGGGGGGGEKSGSAFDGKGLIAMSDRAAGLAEVFRRRAS